MTQVSIDRNSPEQKREDEARECVKALLDVQEGLTDWEVDFVCDCSRRSLSYTEKQLNCIFKIYDKHC